MIVADALAPIGTRTSATTMLNQVVVFINNISHHTTIKPAIFFKEAGEMVTRQSIPSSLAGPALHSSNPAQGSLIWTRNIQGRVMIVPVVGGVQGGVMLSGRTLRAAEMHPLLGRANTVTHPYMLFRDKPISSISNKNVGSNECSKGKVLLRRIYIKRHFIPLLIWRNPAHKDKDIANYSSIFLHIHR